MLIKLHGLSHDGRAVGRAEDGKVIFVNGGLPGQMVEVELEKAKKSFAEGRIVRVAERSEEEREAPCAHAAECGGCPWQSLNYQAQCRWKKQLVVDALTRIGKCDLSHVDVADIAPSPDEWHCRNKMEFAFDGAGKLGLRKRDSHEVVEITACLMQDDLSMAVLEEIRDFTRQNHPQDWRFVVIRRPQAGGCQVELISGQQADPARALGERLMALAGVSGFVHSVRKAPGMVAYGEKKICSLGAGLTETLQVNGRTLEFSLGHDAFFQVNSKAAEKLYSLAAELAQAGPGQELWDVYCGVGGLALAAGAQAKSVLGLESSGAAVKLARENAARNGMNHCTFESASAEYLGKFFKQRGVPDILLADPPRAGLAPAALNAILKARPARLLLVSCNPATLARDIAALRPAYTLKKVRPVDIFPQTEHAECVVLLEKTAQ